jgi:hypothetical protein
MPPESALMSETHRPPGPPLRLELNGCIDWCELETALSDWDEERYVQNPLDQRALHALLRHHATVALDAVITHAADALNVAGQVVVTGIDANHLALAALMAAFGWVTAEGNASDTQLVHDVTPKTDPGALVLSQQIGAFALHTDTACLPQPVDWVGLLGVTPAAASRTTSLTLHVDRVVERLSPRDVDVLCESRFRVSTGDSELRVSILEPSSRGGYDIRYRADVLDWGTSLGLDASAHGALRRLEQVVTSSLPAGFSLDKGDLLILDNRKVLHGRTAVDGRRLVKRVRARSWTSLEARQLRAIRVRGQPAAVLRKWAQSDASVAPATVAQTS